MAPQRGRSALLPDVVLFLLLLLVTHAECADISSEDQQVLQKVNDYRTSVAGLPALATNNKASCVGEKFAEKLQGTPCTNATGAGWTIGQTPEFSDFPDMISSCKVDMVNVTEGQILTDCVPVSASSPDAPSVAGQNFTRVQAYQKLLNDTTYTSAGVGSEGVWYVMVLATDTPGGSYGYRAGSGSRPSQRVQLPLLLTVLLGVLFSLCGNAV